MLNKIPENIKRSYKISIIITVIILILGIIFKRPELYFSFVIGSIVSMIIMYILTMEVYNMVYIKEKYQGRNPFTYFLRMGIYILGLLLIVFISRKYFPNLVRTNIIACGAGFLNFKISLYINEKIKKFAKRK